MFPLKFKQLIETQRGDIELPDVVWLVYAVCACEHDSCGWTGWLIEALYKKEEKNTAGEAGKRLLSANYEQKCPNCHKQLFRTDISLQLEVSTNQTPIHGIAGVDYEVAKIEYIDSSGKIYS